MKKILILLMGLTPYCLIAQITNVDETPQHHKVMTFIDINTTEYHGLVINTKLPNDHENNTTVYIKGYDYNGRIIGIQISWFYDHTEKKFYNPAASSTGGWTPRINLWADNGNIKIYLIDYEYTLQPNLEITAFCNNPNANCESDWFQNWTIEDVAEPSGKAVEYINRFKEVHVQDLYSEGILNGANSTITNNLTVGHSTTSAELAVSNNAIIGGRVGIGTVTSPAVPLHTSGGVRFESLAHSTSDKVLSTDLYGNLITVDKGGYWQPHTTNASTIVYDGIVGVGMSNSAAISTSAVSTYNYKLLVGGTLGARKVRVTLATSWADYVFADNYKLQPLTEIEKFIKANKHLEGVPTETEVKENGVDLGETQVILLKKIEELTLHLIELNKKIEKLEQRKKQ